MRLVFKRQKNCRKISEFDKVPLTQWLAGCGNFVELGHIKSHKSCAFLNQLEILRNP